jgi:hypothetical protein
MADRKRRDIVRWITAWIESHSHNRPTPTGFYSESFLHSAEYRKPTLHGDFFIKRKPLFSVLPDLIRHPGF